MTPSQWFNIAIIGVLATVLVVAYFLRKSKRPSLSNLFIYSTGLIVFGGATDILTGNTFENLVWLEDTGGWGRAFVSGLGMLTATLAISILVAIRKATKQ